MNFSFTLGAGGGGEGVWLALCRIFVGPPLSKFSGFVLVIFKNIKKFLKSTIIGPVNPQQRVNFNWGTGNRGKIF